MLASDWDVPGPKLRDSILNAEFERRKHNLKACDCRIHKLVASRHKKHGYPGRGTALYFDSIRTAIVSDLYWLWLGLAGCVSALPAR